MNYFKEEILDFKNNNLVDMVKFLTTNEDSYLEYYAILRAKNLVELYNSFENTNFISIKGADGSGKTSFKKLIKKSFDENIKVFEFNCNEITELDDIFFKFYKFMLAHPQKKEIIRAQKSNFNPPSLDEQIMQYIKNANNLVLIFDNMEKLTDETGGLKSTNLKSFIEFLSTLDNIKIITISSTNIKNLIDIDARNIFEIKINGLTEKEFCDFISIFKIEIPKSLQTDVFNKTKGYIHSLELLSVTAKLLDLPISSILNEFSTLNIGINEFLAKKIFSKISDKNKKLLFYFALFRHEIDNNILKNIDKFTDIQADLTLLKKYKLIEGNNPYEIREFLKIFLQTMLSDRDKLNIHEKIANFYAEQIPLKPTERIIDISRTSMYSEKFYHQNIANKFNKNFELQSEKFKEYNQNKATKIDSQKIKYMSSPTFIPAQEMLQIHKDILDQKKVDIDNNQDNNEEIILSEEEKALLDYNTIDILDRNEKQIIPELNILENDSPNNTFADNISDINIDDINHLNKADKLLEKGMHLVSEGDFNQSYAYIKNSMSYYQDNDNENFFNAKITLANAYIESYNYKDAKQCLNEILETKTSPSVRIEAIILLASIYENEQDTSFAFVCYNDALNIAKENNLENYLAKIYFKIALLQDDLNNLNKAIENYINSSKFAQISNDFYILGSCYANLAAIYEENNNIDKAITYYKKSLRIDALDENFEGQTKTLSALGNIFILKKDIKLAIKLFINATKTAKQTNDKYLIAASYLELGDTFFNIKNYQNALKAYMLARKNIDNTISTDSRNKIECRFDMLLDEVGENAYKFLLKELKNNERKTK